MEQGEYLQMSAEFSADDLSSLNFLNSSINSSGMMHVPFMCR